MIYKKSSIDIIGDIIGDMTFPVHILSVINMGGGKHNITVCDMYHAQPGFSVTIGAKDYLIEEVIPSVSSECGERVFDVIKVKGDAATITAEDFDMYPPFFFYGTPLAEGVELAQVNKARNKTPMYWLRLDDFSEKFFEDETITKERELKFRLYPLTQADHEKWLTSEAKHRAIDPMHRLAEIFINQLKSNPGRFDVDNLTWDIPAVFPKFGVISINRGVEKPLWHDKLAGVELNVTLTVYKQYICDTCES